MKKPLFWVWVFVVAATCYGSSVVFFDVNRYLGFGIQYFSAVSIGGEDPEPSPSPTPDPGPPPLTNAVSVDWGATNTTKFCAVADDASMDWSTALSAGAWVKCASGAESVALGKVNYNSSRREWFFERDYVDGSKFSVFLSSPTSQNCKVYRSSITVCDSAWHHFAFTFAGGTDTLKLYVDGVEDTTPTLDTNNACGSIKNTDATFLISGAYNGAGVITHFQGLIDEPAVWLSTLTADDIAEIYNSGEPVDLSALDSASGLMSWWRMGDDASDSTTTLIDQVGSNDGACTALVAGDFSSDVP